MLTRVAYRKTSLVDFPGRVAATVFLPGCDFRCPYCHNAALVAQEAGSDPGGQDGGLATIGEFLAFVNRRKRMISGVAISGGEPLLHEETPGLVAALGELGLAVKLDTNGSFPGRLAALLGAAGASALEFVALDLKTAPSAYARVAPRFDGAAARVLESIRLLRAAGARRAVRYELRITCAPGIVGPAEAVEIAGLLETGDEVVLQAFRPGGCLDPAWDAVEPYGAADMEEMLGIIRQAAPLARIRGTQALATAIH